MIYPRRASSLLLVLSLLALSGSAKAEEEANACAESKNQAELRTELADIYGLKRHIAPTAPAVWALETMGAKHCEVSCRNNSPYNNFYLTYKGFEASGKACEGETSVVMTGYGLVKMLATCMAGCDTAPAPTPDK